MAGKTTMQESRNLTRKMHSNIKGIGEFAHLLTLEATASLPHKQTITFIFSQKNPRKDYFISLKNTKTEYY